MWNVELKNGFELTGERIEAAKLRAGLQLPAAGGVAIFEGVVRDHHDGRRVRYLEYEAYQAMALKEGAAILAEAAARFPVLRARAVHRLGRLEIGETAVWVGVASAHRAEAFDACEWIIDQIKMRAPIWKKEFYADGAAEWVACHRCAGKEAAA